MLWFWLSLFAATLYAGSNFIDKYLVAKTLKDVSTTTVSAIEAVAGLPFAFIFSILVAFYGNFPNLKTFILGSVAGWILIIAFQAYYKALRLADASIVASLFQLIIPFNYIFGLIFLNESPSVIKLTGCLAIMIRSNAYRF